MAIGSERATVTVIRFSLEEMKYFILSFPRCVLLPSTLIWSINSILVNDSNFKYF